MRLHELVHALPPSSRAHLVMPSGGGALENPEISSFHYRAQDVRPGGLFVAIPGFRADGHDFIPSAVDKGAAAIFAQRAVAECPVPVVLLDDTRRRMPLLAAHFYGNPSEKMTVVGITGTNGKTTTSLLVEAILQAAGFETGVIGTIDWHYRGQHFDNPVTTPESPDIQAILAKMAAAGVTHVVMEASSHAIDLHRLDHCWLDVGVFTNLTQDHLDFHWTMDDYWGCKQRLFTDHLPNARPLKSPRAVINCINPYGRELVPELTVPVITVGMAAECDLQAVDARYGLDGTRARVATSNGEIDLFSALVGAYNLENLLCAAGVGLSLGLEPATIREGIARLKAVPGRLEAVASGRNIFVDYAHTPDALKNVLSVLRALTPGRLICVFGCGGDRDRKKRPLMGGFAGQYADVAIVTSDNPRSEAPMAIIEEILPGLLPHCRAAASVSEIGAAGGKRFLVDPDRAGAIGKAIQIAGPADAVLIAGKGHETYQIVGPDTLSFDDREAARRVLAEERAPA